MAMPSDERANMRVHSYYYRGRHPIPYSRQRGRQNRAGSSRGPQRPEPEPDLHVFQQKKRWSMKRIVALALSIFILLLVIAAGLVGGLLWKSINDSLQNDPVIGKKLTLILQINQPKNVTQPATIQVSYVDANDNAASIPYPLPGKTFILKGEIIHLLGAPAHFRLLGVTGGSTNIHTAPSSRSDSTGSDADSSENGLLESITPCSVVIGQITSTPTQTFTITVIPDGTPANSCTLSQG